MPIQSTVLGTTQTNVFVSTGNTAITTLYLCNRTGGSAITVNVHCVPSGANATPDNLIYHNLRIQGEDTYVVDTEKLLLSNGDSIRANAASTGNVVATISFTSI